MKRSTQLFLLTALTIFVMWGLLLPFSLSLVPQNEWSNLIKLILTIAFAYFGGIAIPLVLLITAIALRYFERHT